MGDSMKPTAKIRFRHLALIGGFFLLGIVVAIACDPFAGMGTGFLIGIILSSMLASHLVAAIVSFFQAKFSWKSVLLLGVMNVSFPLLLA